ncbi:MAG: rhodanese-like domain-containing protein [Desulfocapsaceae bacterium]|jgi:rhodanese-related sulfurtransferase|nr:rhodanese-like domain-containing protein [Desulfocapsaceae bacterium]
MKAERAALPFYCAILIGCVMSAIIFTGCSAEEDRQPPDSPSPAGVTDAEALPVQSLFRSVSGAEAQELMANRKDLLVIDVRTPQERRQVRLSDSLFIPIGEVMRGRLAVPREQPVLVVCAVGGRSYVVGRALLAMGYHEVYNLDGGIEAWRRARLPVETGPES